MKRTWEAQTLATAFVEFDNLGVRKDDQSFQESVDQVKSTGQMVESPKSQKCDGLVKYVSIKHKDPIQNNLFEKHFELMNELLLICDSSFKLMVNNYSESIEQAIVNTMQERFNFNQLMKNESDETADIRDCFSKLESDTIVCSEETYQFLKAMANKLNVKLSDMDDDDPLESIRKVFKSIKEVENIRKRTKIGTKGPFVSIRNTETEASNLVDKSHDLFKITVKSAYKERRI